MRTKGEFIEEVLQVADIYDRDNGWFGFRRGGLWDKGTWWQFILAAYGLYVNTASRMVVLLGDTKIRSDPSLLFNFGTVSNANSPQEKADRELFTKLMRARTHIAQESGQEAVELMGQGSILSAYRWSPLLNDALMIGSMECGREFVLALNEDEQEAFATLRVDINMSDSMQQRTAMYGGAVRNTVGITAGTVNLGRDDLVNKDPREIWLRFLKKVPRVLWAGSQPRVFAREVLGLMVGGYRPQFHMHQLSFSPNGGSRVSFRRYLDALHEVNYHSCDRGRILGAIGGYLFNDSNALL